MNNEQFRKLMLANSAKNSSNNASPKSASGAHHSGVSLGSRMKSSIPMTP